MPSNGCDIQIDIAMDSDLWSDEDELQSLANTTCKATQDWLAENQNQPFPENGTELSLLFTDDNSIQKINAEWRDLDKPTNVLSFPTKDLAPGTVPLPILGDIIFSYETIQRESVEMDKTFKDHLTHLFIHGFLHLLGYDHINDTDAELMESIETRILHSLGLSDPYAN